MTAALLLAAAALAPQAALAALGASVTLVGPDPIHPGEVTTLRIELSNSGSTPITALSFPHQPQPTPDRLPGVLPNGLRIAGAASYTCNDPNGNVSSPGAGVLTAATGTQAITLTGGNIPANFGGTDGSCVILIPVTAGSSTGAAANYAYTISNASVTGTDGSGPVANSGAVTQTIGVRAVDRPTITKAFSNGPAVLGGAPATLTFTVSNPNSIALPDFQFSDVFPLAGATPALRVAPTPNAQLSCPGGGTVPAFAPAPGDTTLSATGGTVAPNNVCTISVDVVANTTNGAYSVDAVNTINRSTQFANGLGLVPAQDASATLNVRSPLAVAKAFSSGALASGEAASLTITLSNSASGPLAITTFDDNPIDGRAPPAPG